MGIIGSEEVLQLSLLLGLRRVAGHRGNRETGRIGRRVQPQPHAVGPRHVDADTGAAKQHDRAEAEHDHDVAVTIGVEAAELAESKSKGAHDRIASDD